MMVPEPVPAPVPTLVIMEPVLGADEGGRAHWERKKSKDVAAPRARGAGRHEAKGSSARVVLGCVVAEVGACAVDKVVVTAGAAGERRV